MAFHLYDRSLWERSQYYDYYKNIIKTRYTLTVSIDITKLLGEIKAKHFKFYPVFIYILMKAVNEQKEMRMALDAQKNPGYWDECHPSYTVFHKDNGTFSDIWTEYSSDFQTFYGRVTEDMDKYGNIRKIKAKPGQPPNFTSISCVPWLNYGSYAIDTYSESDMLFPIILFGKYEESGGTVSLPVSVSMDHAAADGYHVCRFFNRVKELCLTAEL